MLVFFYTKAMNNTRDNNDSFTRSSRYHFTRKSNSFWDIAEILQKIAPYVDNDNSVLNYKCIHKCWPGCVSHIIEEVTKKFFGRPFFREQKPLLSFSDTHLFDFFLLLFHLEIASLNDPRVWDRCRKHIKKSSTLVQKYSED